MSKYGIIGYVLDRRIRDHGLSEGVYENKKKQRKKHLKEEKQ